MSLLLDENLSPRLVARLSSLFPRLTHVREVGLKQASDQRIWEYAQANGFNIVTADTNFAGFAQRRGHPPKMIHIRHCAFPFAIIEEMLRRNAVRISEFERDDRASLLVIDRYLKQPGFLA